MSQVLHNIALSEAQLGNWEKAQENLAKALDYKTESKLSIIDKALQATLKQKLFKLVEFPSKTLFKPNKHYVAELEKKDYLGKAKVVASVVPQDEFSGFAPLQPQVKEGPAAPKEPEVLRTLEGEAHTVLFEFVPETSDELAVVPGNIVFVLQKGADNWAYVVFNERKGLVPYNYLERLDISVGSRQVRGVARLHSRDAPSRPERIQGLTPGSNGSNENTQQQPRDNSCFVKIRFTYNFAVSVPYGSPYVVLIEKISKKLNLSPTAISLSSDARGKNLIDNNKEMEDVWNSAQGGSITLWCTTKEQSDEKSQKEIILVALHSYESSNPEDLSFKEGDKIQLLSRVNQDWLEGQCNGNTGIFPATFAEEVPGTGQ